VESPKPLNETEELMIILSYIAYKNLYDFVLDRRAESMKTYQDISKLLSILKPAQELVWGPVVGETKFEVISSSLIYVTRNTGAQDEYTVVIRGTNPFSLSTLIKDLEVGVMLPWGRKAPTGALISKGTYQLLNSYLKTTPVTGVGLPGEGKTLREFLMWEIGGHQVTTINFTGHSLGGVMASTLGLWFREELPKDNPTVIKIYSIAGPTTGNDQFAEYSDALLGSNCVRYANELDVAAHLWVEKDLRDTLPKLYEPYRAFTHLADRVAGHKYTHSGNVKPIPSAVQGKMFLAEAVYQHLYPYRKALKNQPMTVLNAMDEILKVINPLGTIS
jgi:hypothetical protein